MHWYPYGCPRIPLYILGHFSCCWREMLLIPHSSPTSKANWRHRGLFLQVKCTEEIDMGHLLGVCSGQDKEDSLKVCGWEHLRLFPSFEEWFSDHFEHLIVFVSYCKGHRNSSWYLCRLESKPVFLTLRVQLSHLIFKVTTIPPGSFICRKYTLK